MRRYLLAALWPAGMAAIGAVTVTAARRAAAARPPAGTPADGLRSGSESGIQAVPGGCPGGPNGELTRASDPGLPADLAKLAAMSTLSGLGAYGVMTLLGPTVVGSGPAIDEPLYKWVNTHQIRAWAAVMERLNRIGNTWTTWGVAPV